MNPAGSDPAFADAVLACRLFLASPPRFGGIVLRGASPARDAVVAALHDAMTSAGRSVRRLPGHVDDARLLGGIDIAASLVSGRPVEERGLLAQARGGALVVPMAERMEAGIAGRLAQALDEGEDAPALILLDDGIEPDEAPPASLIERCAFWCDLSATRASACEPLECAPAASQAALDDEGRAALVAVAASFGIASVRPLLFAQGAASAHAGQHGRAAVTEPDLAAAVRLVLAPRARQMPERDEPPEDESEPPPPPPPDNPEEGDKDDASDPAPSDKPLEEMLVEAAAAAIPPDLLAQLAQGRAPRRSGGGGSGKRRKSGLRGKPLGARPGMPRGGARLALIDTLRAAVPWQEVRRREAVGEAAGEADTTIRMRKEDLRVRRFEDKAARVTIFALDASGSAAAARLAEAKGAIELMLAQAYVTRSEVAVIAFRAEQAELLLPPTRSLTRARRALSELPGGGGTPLAMGLNAARECAAMVTKRGRSPSLVILTDGRANLDADGQPGRKKAAEDAEAAARAIAREGIEGIVIDISARAGPEGAKLAELMQARYLALPRADAGTLAGAINLVDAARREQAA